jgi:hypothetical protein
MTWRAVSIRPYVLGFVLHPGSYLRNSWNILDFFIVIIGLVGFFASGSGGADQIMPATSFAHGPGRTPGASFYTRRRLSLTGARAKAWCLLIHAEASLSPSLSGHVILHMFRPSFIELTGIT